MSYPALSMMANAGISLHEIYFEVSPDYLGSIPETKRRSNQEATSTVQCMASSGEKYDGCLAVNGLTNEAKISAFLIQNVVAYAKAQTFVAQTFVFLARAGPTL